MATAKVTHSIIPGLSTRISMPIDSAPVEIPSSSDIKILGGGQKPWQRPAFNLLKDERFAFCVAFCGSGKSTLQVYLAAHDYIKSDFKQKQLIIVPQTAIADGFVNDKEELHIKLRLDRKVYTWSVEDNYCDSRNNVVDKLVTWLLQPVASIHRKSGQNDRLLTGGIAVATHQALAAAWKKIERSRGDEGLNQAIKNLTLRIDEAHHVTGVFIDSDSYTREEKNAIEGEANNLGMICRYIFDRRRRIKSSKIHLATATPYRGDRQLIVSPGVRELFKFYYLSWIEHWKTLGIETFSIQYETYKSKRNLFDLVKDRIESEPNERHMVIVPSTGTKWRGEHGEYWPLLRKLEHMYPGQVLDLVTPETQDENKKKLVQEPKLGSDFESKYRIVVTCMIGREGLDWVPCSRLHNTAVEASLTLAVQTSGRPLRKYQGKKTVKIYNYSLGLSKGMSAEKKREVMTDRTNGILVAMQWDDFSNQLIVPRMPAEPGKAKPRSTPQMDLQEMLGSEFEKVMTSFTEETASFGNKATDAQLEMAASAVLEDVKLTKAARKQVVSRLKDAHTQRLKNALDHAIQEEIHIHGIDISFLREAGFDKLEQMTGLDNRIFYCSDHDLSHWNEIRGYLSRRITTFDQDRLDVGNYLQERSAA